VKSKRHNSDEELRELEREYSASWPNVGEQLEAALAKVYERLGRRPESLNVGILKPLRDKTVADLIQAISEGSETALARVTQGVDDLPLEALDRAWTATVTHFRTLPRNSVELENWGGSRYALQRIRDDRIRQFDPRRSDFRNNPDKSEPGTTRVICAWCGAHIRGPESATAKTSHGICRVCYAKEVPTRPYPDEKKSNPDEDLRDLERLAAEGDPFALKKLRAARRRLGLPSGVTWRGAKGRLKTAREVVQHMPESSGAGWTNEEYRIHVYETSRDFQIEDLDTGESRGMGDGVDMFTTASGRSLWPGSVPFNQAMTRMVARDGAQLREAYFGVGEEESEAVDETDEDEDDL
jgi:hypothetical protein